MYSVGKVCHQEDRYDQEFIAQIILKHMELDEGKYWKQKAKEYLAPIPPQAKASGFLGQS